MTAESTPPAALDPAGGGEKPPTASPYRIWTPDRPNPTGGTVISVKRACNGCGNLLGDVTDAELERAVAGLRAEDVRAECPTCAPGLTPLDPVDAFNEDNPVGTPVRYWPGTRDGQSFTGVVDASAALLGGHAPVVWVRPDSGGGRGAMALTHVEPLTGPAEIEVTMTVSWRLTVDPEKPEWSWLANNPRAEWPELIQQDMDGDCSAYEAFCQAADGPYNGPTYDVEEIR